MNGLRDEGAHRTMSGSIYEAIAELLRQGRRGAVITIVETVGSTPRKAGAKMLVTDEGKLVGTVGGGCVEADLVAYAQRVIAEGKPATYVVDLTAKTQDENDMLCGGKMKAFIEPIVADEKLVIFGAGHISRALHDLACKLDLRLIVTDDRPGMADGDTIEVRGGIYHGNLVVEKSVTLEGVADGTPPQRPILDAGGLLEVLKQRIARERGGPA